jgi:flagellar export protein FliJ
MARRFRFNLQTALDIRQQKEDEARRQFAAALRVLAEAVETRTRIRAKRAEIVAQVREGTTETLLHGSQCLDLINQQLAGAHALVERQMREVETRRQALIASSQEREALSMLRDRKRAEHDSLAQKAEQRELDEAGARQGNSGLTAPMR